MHRTLFQKKEKIQKSDFPDFPVDVALIPFMNYNAQVAFKKRIAK